MRALLDNINSSWHRVVDGEVNKPYFNNLVDTVDNLYKCKTVFPKKDDIFNALNSVSLDKVKVVILGQDPYHSKGQAIGHAFAVGKGADFPPSLVNIFKEIDSEVTGSAGDKSKYKSNDATLKNWIEDGVLLLNSVLTVVSGKPNSCKDMGWENFTDAIIGAVASTPTPKVFLLWGNGAIKKSGIIKDNNAHNNCLVLTAPHPSPLSSHRGFFGCGHFVKANKFLKDKNLQPIRWQ